MSMYGVPYGPLEPGEDSMTKQAFKDEVDINFIVNRFAETGLISHIAGGIPQFVDASALGDYRSIIEQVRSVEKYFDGLPAKVRTSFGNDASRFMDFLESGASREDLEKLGIEILGDKRGEQQIQRRRDDAEVARLAALAAVAAVGAPEEPGPPEGAGTVLT